MTTTRPTFEGVKQAAERLKPHMAPTPLYRSETLSRALLAGATVTIEDTPFSTTTNVNGVYSFASVPAGNYDVRAEKFGYASQTAAVSVVALAAVSEVGSVVVSVRSALRPPPRRSSRCSSGAPRASLSRLRPRTRVLVPVRPPRPLVGVLEPLPPAA